MKRNLVSLLALLAMMLLANRTEAQQPAASAQNVRRQITLADGWSFHQGDVEGAADTAVALDDSWEHVSIPHTWNAKDGEDGGSNYFKGECWYRQGFNRRRLHGRQIALPAFSSGEPEGGSISQR